MELDMNIFRSEIENLEKKEQIFMVSDFDDTIFSTHEVREKDIRKWRRWKEWNEYIKNKIGYKKFVEDFYKWKNFPKNIIKILQENEGLILTAWDEELQKLKIEALKLERIPLKVVEEAKQKPFEMVKYIVKNLKYIPKEIHIFEDRPEVFIDTEEKVEEILNIDVKIFKVEMNGNNKEIKIEEI